MGGRKVTTWIEADRTIHRLCEPIRRTPQGEMSEMAGADDGRHRSVSSPLSTSEQ